MPDGDGHYKYMRKTISSKSYQYPAREKVIFRGPHFNPGGKKNGNQRIP